MQAFWQGAGTIVLWIAPMVVVILVVRKLFRIPDELFRKVLHFVLMIAYIPLVFVYDVWWHTALFGLLLLAVAYPLLTLLGRIPTFSSFVNERKKGEYRDSCILALCMMAVAAGICWGWLGERYLVLACIYAWGVGDGFAALVGKRFGRHKLRLKWADPRKSVEGSAAMFVFSTLAVLAVMLARGGMSLGQCLLVAAVGSGVSTLVEMCTRGGYDTITCPAAAMAVILPLVHLMGG